MYQLQMKISQVGKMARGQSKSKSLDDYVLKIVTIEYITIIIYTQVNLVYDALCQRRF